MSVTTNNLTVAQAARLLGVSAATLRRWEAQGLAMPDAKTLGGHRRYSPERVQQIAGKMRR